jgi:glycosyltransferase involved in cell wall biosynthesis
LLKALAQLPGGRISILFAGWGADYQLARDMARQLGVADRVAFLGAVLSKPLLYRMFGIADLVIDQFHFGTYGTASLEAMGRGTPVMVAIDEAPYRDDPDNLPPVLNAWSVEDIARQLGAVLDGGIDLEMRSRAAQDWVARTHGEPAAARRFLNILERRLGAAPLAA